MKVSKTILQAMAVALTVTTVTACINDKTINPKTAETEKKAEPGKKQVPYDCPACGMG